jgi:hypothetical protein
MTSPLVGVGLVALVGVLAFVLRRTRGASDERVVMPETTMEIPGDTANVANAGGELDDEDDTPFIALSSDGHAFTPQGRGVLIAPQRHFRGTRPAGGDATRSPFEMEVADPQPPVLLSPGDLVAARVVRGSADLDPWRLETLGRDRDLVVWPFETRDAAEAAHTLLDQRIVRPMTDPDGEPVQVTDADFETAQDELERTLNELNTGLPEDDDHTSPPNEWSNRR